MPGESGSTGWGEEGRDEERGRRTRPRYLFPMPPSRGPYSVGSVSEPAGLQGRLDGLSPGTAAAAGRRRQAEELDRR